jgi:LAO/AO transport system kinase
LDLLKRLLKGDHRAIAKSISEVENNTPLAKEILDFIHPYTGKARTIGVTGPSGVGKSCLINALTSQYRAQGLSVGIICFDPTSPISGGAILGDRLRMVNNIDNEGVYIRSMATRGNSGGLSKAFMETIRILDASGKDIIIVENVGAGQSNVEISNYVDTTLVVMTVGFGDSIQMMKAGILEIRDIFVVNKIDLLQSDRLVSMLKDLLEFEVRKGWSPVIISTNAIKGVGISKLTRAIEKHRIYLIESGDLLRKREKRSEKEISEKITNRFNELIEEGKDSGYSDLIKKVAKNKIPPDSVVDAMMERIINRYGIKKKRSKNESK